MWWVPHAAAMCSHPRQELGLEQAVLSGGAVYPLLVLLYALGPTSGEGWLLLAVTRDVQDACPRALGPGGSFCAVRCGRRGVGAGACPWLELWFLGPDAREVPIDPRLHGAVLVLTTPMQGAGGTQQCPGQGSWGRQGGPAALELLTLSLCVQLCSKRGLFCKGCLWCWHRAVGRAPVPGVAVSPPLLL